MIIGVGIDMIEVDRVFEKIRKDNGFKERVFSGREIEFCEVKASPGEHYAARFAGKEAFLKATGSGLALGYNLSDIEILSEDSGKPVVVLQGSFKELASKKGWNKIHISLSHLKTAACAFVVIEG